MDPKVTDQELRVFYSNERRLLALLVQVHQVDPTVAIFVIAFWLFLEHSGKPDIVQGLLGSDNPGWVRFMILEAQAVVAYLRDPRVPPTTSLNLTGGLTRSRLTFEEFADRRSEIVQFMNDVVASDLRRAVSDIFVLPVHALRYMIELVPLRPEPHRTNLIGSGAGTGLFPHARGYPYPSAGSLNEHVPAPEGLRWTQTTGIEGTSRHGTMWRRRRSRSPVRQEELGSLATIRLDPLGGLGQWSLHQTHQQQAPAPYVQSVYTGMHELPADASIQAGQQLQSYKQHIHTAWNEWEAGPSFQPQPPVRPRELVPIQQIVQTPMTVPVVQQPGVGLVPYQYQVVQDGWVMVPAAMGAVVAPQVYQLPVTVQQNPPALQLVPTGPRRREDAQISPTYYQQMAVKEAELAEGTGSEHADSWDSVGEGAGRTLFVTFSKGFPISATELQEYLTREYGDIVENVIPERTKRGQDPVYTRVVLKSPELVDLVLQGNQKVQMLINGRDAWFRLFTSTKRRRSQGRKHREPN